MGFLFVAFLIFTGAFLVAAHYAWTVPKRHEASAVATRLRDLRLRSGSRTRTGGDLMRREQKGTFAFLSDFVNWLGILRRLQEIIDQANLSYRAVDVAAVTAILFLGPWILFGLFGLEMFFLRLLICGLLAFIPIAFVLYKRSARIGKFETQLPDAIDLFNRSMKAGHTIHSGLETIANETSDPIRMEFKKVVEELGLGSQIDAALLNLGKRIPLIDLKFFITGLILQRQTGADMVEVLENLSLLIRERLNMAAKMKAHTSQQRLSAGILCALPVLLGTVFWIMRPEMMNMLVTDDTGKIFFTYGIVSEIIGILIIRKVANPKF
ncbi:MAG: type II secretion system F family protein [Bryobacteraceae bacterium]